MTEETLAGRARSRGAAPGGARAVGRCVLAQAAGRPAPERPSGKLLAQLEASFALPAAEVIADADGTVRFAVRLDDGEVVETVLIHQAVSDLRPRERWTVCVSSQVGCARGCVFCETGPLGLERNLTARGIVAQYALARR